LAQQNIDGPTAGYQRLIGGLFVAGVALLIVKRKEVMAVFSKSSNLANLPPVAGETAVIRMPAVEKWRRVWPWVLANSFAGQTLGVSCYQWALKSQPTGIVLPIVAITPLVVIPFAAMLEHEPIEPRSIIGGVVAVIGAVGLALSR
jgi:drug/metabolite transporter (DMT)-like permease